MSTKTELLFSDPNQAMQHLADLTGKKIVVADSPSPEHYTKEELKKVHKALGLLAEVDPELKGKAFKSLPDELKLEYNYSKWKNT